MSTLENYRSFLTAAARMALRLSLASTLAVSLLALPAGCESQKAHRDMKKEQMDRWNASRAAIMYQLAKQQYEAGELDKCRETVGKGLALGYAHAPLSVLAAKVEIEGGNLELAQTHLKGAVQVDGNDPEAYYLLGVVYQRWQKLDVAHDYYKLAWEKKPGEALYLLAMIEMKLSLNQLDEAQKVLDEKLVYFEQSAAVRVALAKVHALKGDYEKASKYYRDAVILTPDDVALRQTYGEALYFAGKYTDALPVLEELQKNPKVIDRNNLQMILGQTYLQLRRTNDARACFQEVVQANAGGAVVWVNLAKVALQAQDPAGALVAAERATRMEPRNVPALIVTALAQQKLKKWADASETLARARRLAPDDTTVLCMLGVSSASLGQKDQAAEYYAKALEVNPNDTWAQELLASVKPAER